MNKQEQLKFIEGNYPLYTNHKSNRRIRHNFFNNIQTELQAYLLGFYAADGSVDEKRKTFRIHLSNKDSEIVYLYKDIISPDARLFSVNAGTKNNVIRTKNIIDNGSIGVDITSAILVADLVKLGIGYNKTRNGWILPNIPKELIRHFIRGYFDGDGCISCSYVKEQNNRKARMKMHFDIDAKLESVIDILNNELHKNNINSIKYYLKRDNMWRLSSSSWSTCKDMFNYLYKDCNFCLSRKFNKFNYYVNTEMTVLLTDHCNA